MNRILDLGAQRFYRTVPKEEWDVRAKETELSHSENDIRMRFYPKRRMIRRLVMSSRKR